VLLPPLLYVCPVEDCIRMIEETFRTVTGYLGTNSLSRSANNRGLEKMQEYAGRWNPYSLRMMDALRK